MPGAVGTRRAVRPVRALTALGVAAALGVAVDVALDPAHRHVPLCPFHAATGWWCPLCGGLRAVDALVHGQPGAAVHDNLLVVAGLPIAVLLWLDALARVRAGQAPRRWPRAGTITLVVLGVAFTVLRNLPWAAALRP